MIPHTTQVFELNQTQFLLAVPDEKALKEWYEQNKDAQPFPYWAKVWPSAKVLSQFISSNHKLVAGKKVIEIAAGLGLPSLLAAQFAKEVICTDVIPLAVEMINLSVEKNALKNIKCKVFNWNEELLSGASEVLLMSDVNYNPADFPQLLLFIETQLKKGMTILLSTPQRITARSFIKALTIYIQKQQELIINESEAAVVCSVFVLHLHANS